MNEEYFFSKKRKLKQAVEQQGGESQPDRKNTAASIP